jgi:hypothetical protein
MENRNWFSFTKINHELDGVLKSKAANTAPLALKNVTNFPFLN